MKKNILLSLLAFLFYINIHAQKLISGPMLGYVEHREAMIWLEVAADVNKIEIKYWKKSEPTSKKNRIYTGELHQDFNPIKLALPALDVDTEYEYELYLDDKLEQKNYKMGFRTRDLWEWRKPAPDFSFLAGSCMYINDEKYDRPGKPYGASPAIFDQMSNTPSSFMMWLGDNFYLREADYSSPYGIAYRASHDRAVPQLQRFLAAMPHYAIWDDHDYGSNDGDKTFPLKNITRQKFIDYWCNKSFGEDNEGIYTHFIYNDCEFFLLDDRWFRSNDAFPATIDDEINFSKRMFGDAQMEWLQNALRGSSATFKFIVTGSQALNSNSKFDCFQSYPAEFQELTDYLEMNKISGVLFLTGDRHHSEVIKMNRENNYPLYDITASPLTSGVSSVLSGAEKDNPLRVPGTLVVEQNFAKISISGIKGSRKLKVEFITKDAKKLGEFSVSESELK